MSAIHTKNPMISESRIEGGRKGGLSRSSAKVAVSRLNGPKGGRPRLFRYFPLCEASVHAKKPSNCSALGEFLHSGRIGVSSNILSTTIRIVDDVKPEVDQQDLKDAF